jgi:hypothetical protein
MTDGKEDLGVSIPMESRNRGSHVNEILETWRKLCVRTTVQG